MERVIPESPPKCFKVNSEEFSVIDESSGKIILPEKVLQKTLSESSHEEQFIRLIFSELLASYCPSQKIAEGIAITLKNRELKATESGRNGKDILYEKQQFRSSTGSCDVAKRKEFLCPDLQNPVQKQAWEYARTAYFNVQKMQSVPKVTNYFFLKHFDNSQDSCAKWKGIRPTWAKKENALVVMGDNPECTEFYSAE